MHIETVIMYRNFFKTVLNKENYKKFKKYFWENPEKMEYYIRVYHKLNRNKEKFNSFFEYSLNNEISNTINKLIELEKEKIKKLEKIKNFLLFYYFLKGDES